jgi:hypothetical protein
MITAPLANTTEPWNNGCRHNGVCSAAAGQAPTSTGRRSEVIDAGTTNLRQRIGFAQSVFCR